MNRLEDRGLLTRILCDDDRRGIYTELTPPGGRRWTRPVPPTTPPWKRRSPGRGHPELADLVKAVAG